MEAEKKTEEAAQTRDMRSECWTCLYRREIPGDAHIRCTKPDWLMKGAAYGIRMGWFDYPLQFDPVWKEKLCDNYEENGF